MVGAAGVGLLAGGTVAYRAARTSDAPKALVRSAGSAAPGTDLAPTGSPEGRGRPAPDQVWAKDRQRSQSARGGTLYTATSDRGERCLIFVTKTRQSQSCSKPDERVTLVTRATIDDPFVIVGSVPDGIVAVEVAGQRAEVVANTWWAAVDVVPATAGLIRASAPPERFALPRPT